jgi:hypothetical protein
MSSELYCYSISICYLGGGVSFYGGCNACLSLLDARDYVVSVTTVLLV